MSVVKVLLLYWKLLYPITGKREVFMWLKKVVFTSLPQCLSFRTSPSNRRQIISYSPALTRLINLGQSTNMQ